MNDFIYEPKPENTSPSENEYYCVVGSEEFMDANHSPRVTNENDKRVLAKKVIRDDGSVKYSIKLNSSGKLQNPVSMYGVEKTNSFLDRVCRSQNKFKEVNMKAFNMYVTFLKTKNVAWLHNAEREIE